jgi:hypothetical protein
LTTEEPKGGHTKVLGGSTLRLLPSRGRLLRRGLTVFVVVIALLAECARIGAHEPDGRVVLRYAWAPAASADGSRPLRVSITAVVALSDVQVTAKIPDRTSVAIRALHVAGRASSGPPDPRWPDAGLNVGPLAPGQTVVFDLEVAEPARGGGILAIGLDGADGERSIHEGIGIVVGTPGAAPIERDGVLEFPAEQREPTP